MKLSSGMIDPHGTQSRNTAVSHCFRVDGPPGTCRAVIAAREYPGAAVIR
jgi:hypothetical protein